MLIALLVLDAANQAGLAARIRRADGPAKVAVAIEAGAVEVAS